MGSVRAQPTGPVLHAQEERAQTPGSGTAGIQCAGDRHPARAREGLSMWRVLRRLRARLRYRDFNADLEAELAEHRALAAEALRRAGETPERARTLARRQVGNITLAREAARGVWLAPWLESLGQDVRYASRTLWRSRGFTLTAIATLVLGVGLNTTLFSLANALLLRPWNAPDAHELVLAYHRLDRSSGQILVGVSAPELSYLEGNAKTVTLAG